MTKWADPHAVLWLEDPQHPFEPIPLHIYRMAQVGFKIWETKYGWFAKRRQRVFFPDHFNAILRRRLYKDGGKVCAYCCVEVFIDPPPERKRQFATIEHRTPLSRGGTWKRNNLCCSCTRCNSAKGDLLESEFLDLLDRYPLDGDPANFSRIKNASRRQQASRTQTNQIKTVSRYERLPDEASVG